MYTLRTLLNAQNLGLLSRVATPAVVSFFTSRRKSDDARARSVDLLNTLKQYPESDVRLKTIFDGKASHDPNRHPQIQHAVKPFDYLYKMTKVFGYDTVMQYIHYLKPERQMLHHAIAFVSTNIKTVSMEHFNNTVIRCYETYETFLSDIKDEHQEIRKSSEERASMMVDKYYRGDTDIDKTLTSLINSIPITERMQLDKKNLIEAGYADSLTKQNLSKKILIGTERANHSLLEEGDFDPIPTGRPDEVTAVVVVGAPATGKGVIISRLMKGELGLPKRLNLAELFRAFSDEWHHLLKTLGLPTNLDVDSQYHGVYLREDTFCIFDKIFASLKERIERNEPVPRHCCMEFVCPSLEGLSFFPQYGGNLEIYLTTHQLPWEVVKGSIKRFENTGRLVFPRSILLSMQLLAEGAANIIKGVLDCKNGKAQMEVHDMTYIHEGTHAPKTPVYTVDSSSQKIIIYDLKIMLQSFAYKYINVKADKPEDLFAKTIEDNLKEIVADFKTAHKDILSNMIFVNPEVDLTKTPLNEEHIFAHFNDEGQLVIDNQEIYDNVVKDCKISRVFFSELDHYHLGLNPSI